MSKILYIDTSQHKAVIALVKGEKIIVKKAFKAQARQSEMLLLAIDQLLKKNRLRLANLTGIIVNLGPGHYTGLRVGVATANTLSFALKIPVVGIKNKLPKIERLFQIGVVRLQHRKFKIGNLVVPFYGKRPHITKAKNYRLMSE